MNENNTAYLTLTEDDNGQPLDRVHKIRTEEEAITTLNHLGQHQEAQNTTCPRCGDLMPGKTTRHALSRYAQISVCDHCGVEEALEFAGLMKKRTLMNWDVFVGGKKEKED